MRGLFGCLVLLLATSAVAAPPAGARASGEASESYIPELLRPWTGWVLHDRPHRFCPRDATDESAFAAGAADPGAESCVFATRLELALDEHGGHFSLHGHAYAEVAVPLPGNEEHWPLDVKLGAGRVPVLASDDEPVARVPAGDFTLSGTFAWDELPESVRVPDSVALLELSVRGARIANPARSGKGDVLLQRASAPTEEEGLDLKVQRKVEDGVPLRLVTRIQLEVSGKAREVELGPVLPEGFVVLDQHGDLPMRLLANGRLRVQLRPGSWTCTVTARAVTPVEKLGRPKPQALWPSGDEVWVFEARPEVRRVDVEGVGSVDPQQTPLPNEWKGLPAYALGEKDEMRFTVKRRGNAEPTPDSLALSRELWLDFGGSGYTARDTITGSLTQSWRLSMPAPGQLGRVGANGHDLLITRHGNETGVELRDGALNLVADSRWPGGSGGLPAVGFAHDFASVSATLNLPPGWRLFSVSGVDEVPETWVRRWSLLDLFLVLVLAFGAGRLFGWPTGLLAGVALMLSFPEVDSPHFAWLALVIAEALVQVLPEGRLRTVLRWTRLATVLILALVLLPFIVGHLRSAVYPALEHREVTESPLGGIGFGMAKAPASFTVAAPPMAEPLQVPSPASPPPAEAVAADEKDEDGREVSKPSPKGGAGLGAGEMKKQRRAAMPSKSWNGSYGQSQSTLDQLDRNAIVQTGPGVPSWGWNRIALRWNGPVEQGQRLSLWLVPPWLNTVLAFLRAALLLLLSVQLLRSPVRLWPTGSSVPSAPPLAPTGAPVALLLVVLAAALLPSTARAAEPSAEQLKELEHRLAEPPRCLASTCASIGRMGLKADPRGLELKLDVSAGATVTLPIPSGADSWSPTDVKVDGKGAASLSRNEAGVLYVVVERGNHELLLTGPFGARDTVQLALPLKPHFVSAQVTGWTLDGLHEDGAADDSLQLSRTARSTSEDASNLTPEPPPPFASVTRTLTLGLTWEVTTEVTRLTPTGNAQVLEVPLLQGESVTTKDIHVVKGKVQVNLAPNATSVSWRSVMEPRASVVLRNPSGVAYTEVWHLLASPLWHVEPSGVPELHPETPDLVHQPTWRPYPGETLTLKIEKPEGAPGQSVTIDASELTVSPGLRATDATLTLTARSSRGGQHVLTLPEGALLQSISINGRPEPVRQEGRQVALPLVPGPQQFVLVWREPRPLSASFVTSRVALGLPSVNSTVKVALPSDRWILLVHGPLLGPAVLYWSLILGVFIAAFFLARLRSVPLGFASWFLLGLGLTQVPLLLAATVAGWFAVLGWRKGRADSLGRVRFNFLQVGLVAWTLLAVGVLFGAIEQGLLERPDMQIEGYGSSVNELRWFLDRVPDALAQPWVLSVPMWAYRFAMLAWALWLAASMLRWLPWAWGAFSESTLWKSKPPALPKVVAAGVVPPKTS